MSDIEEIQRVIGILGQFIDDGLLSELQTLLMLSRHVQAKKTASLYIYFSKHQNTLREIIKTRTCNGHGSALLRHHTNNILEVHHSLQDVPWLARQPQDHFESAGLSFPKLQNIRAQKEDSQIPGLHGWLYRRDGYMAEFKII
jgi:hypothetical protein